MEKHTLFFLVLFLSRIVCENNQQKQRHDCADERHLELIRKRAGMDSRKPSLATSKQQAIIFVTGPESTGNRYTVGLIIEAAGCAGKSGHKQPLDHKVGRRRAPRDWSALDQNVLAAIKKSGKKCTVLHRSFPHNNKFVDLKRMARTARAKGFDPRVVVLTRVMPATIDSQVARKHVKNPRKARENIKRAYLEIFDDIIGAELPFTVVTYELLQDKNYVGWMFEELGLEYDESKIPSFHDENSKHLH
jgi:hypothetical protein